MQKRKMNKRAAVCFTAIVLLFLSTSSYALSDQEVLKRIDALERKIEIQQQMLSQQNQTIQQLQNKLKEQNTNPVHASVPASPPDPEAIRGIVAQIMEEAEFLPGWLRGFKYSGDFRLRYESIFNRNDRNDRHRGRFRLRLNIAKKLCDEIDVIVRLATQA